MAAAPSTIVRGLFSRALPANATAEYSVGFGTQITNVALDGDKPGRTVLKLRYLDFEKVMAIPGYDSDDDEDDEFDMDGMSDGDDDDDDASGLDDDKIQKVLAEAAGSAPNGTNEVIEASDDDDDSDDGSLASDMVQAKEIILCSLTAGSVEQYSLNIVLPTDATCEFVVSGPNGVHLFGHFIEQFDPSQDDYDDEGYGESDDESINSDEMGVYDPDADDAPMHQMGMADAAMLAAGSEDDDESDMMDEDADRFAEVADADAAAIEAERLAQAAALKPSPAKKTSSLPKADKSAPTSKPATAAPTAAADVSLEGLSKNQRKKALKKLKADGTAAPAAAAPASATAAAPAPKAAPAAAAASSKKPSKKQTLDNGLVMEDHKLGDGPAAANGKRVSVRYIGKLQNGKTFDSNTKGAPFTFRLGKGEVIKGWDLGVAGMQVGGERKLTVPASLAYGKSGTDGIPSNATLTFDVKLLSVK